VFDKILDMTLSWQESNLSTIAEYFVKGEVVVLPTDTLYGLVAKVDDYLAVKKVYEIKKRNLEKKCIVLISSLEDLELFGIILTNSLRERLADYWPGKFSIELPCTTNDMKYLRCGTDSLSFRWPNDELLCELLKKTGPLIAPSANPEGLEPALNVIEAEKYFGDQVGLYVDGGTKQGSPSTLISLLDDQLKVLRGTL
jgi:L-threonylcarbamoyladenylate synthase